ncbi:hypothetical protein PO909_000092 [Leuciscus waleckii]
MGAVVVGVAAGVGGAMGAGSALGAGLGGGAVTSSTALNGIGTTARILSEIGRAAAGIALAGGFVVKVVKERVRSAENSYSERNSYEIHWNK